MRSATIILGKKSYLSIQIKKKFNNVEIFSLKNFPFKDFKKKKYNIIINSFYSSLKLENIENFEEFFNKSILELANFLDNFPKNKIKKIIYTSSSAVYNSINDNDFKDVRNRKIYSATKFVAENLIKNFCINNNIKFCISRIFNIFGDNEKFSIISKIIESYKSKKKLTLINNGNSIRDFIHVNDVINCYQKILKSNKNEVLDIGSGYGVKINDIIEKLGSHNFIFKKINNNESTFSIAKNININSNKKFSLESYLKKKLRLKNEIKLENITSTKINILHDYLHGSVIYGAGDAGKKLLKIYKQAGRDSISFFVDDDPKYLKKKTTLEGKKILSFIDLVALSKKKIINNIIIAIPSLSSKKLRNLIDRLTPLTLNISLVNSNNFGEKTYLNLTDVTNNVMSDIFKRDTRIKYNASKNVKNKNILITGAGGSIGSELVKQSLASGAKVIALDHSELALYNLKKDLNMGFKLSNLKIVLGSIMDKELLESIKKNNKIDIIFHAAAYKHVNILENNISLAIQNNIFGTLNILEAFNQKKIQIVIISTDKAARPKSVLGATKRISEIISSNCQKSGDYLSDIKVVRFGNVFGSKGSAIELFIDQLNNKLPITLTDLKVKRYFMSIHEACNLVIQVTRLKAEGKIFIFDMGKQIFLKDIIYKLAEIKKIDPSDVNIKIIGLKKGEKLFEELSISKNYLKTSIKEIFFTSEPIYKKKIVNNFINKIKQYIYIKEEKLLRKFIFSFLIREL
jgi:UDP-N-acetylglucosamine 4,6-dehydratase